MFKKRDKGLKSILECKNLKELRLYDAIKLSDESLDTLINEKLELEVILLQENRKMSEQKMNLFLKSLPHLKKLFLDRIFNLKNINVDLPNLTHFSFDTGKFYSTKKKK